MRTAIFIGAMMIAMAINPELDISDRLIKFLATCVMAFVVADCFDFFRGK